MTTQTPAPKASSVSALLASLSTVPPPPQPPVNEDFLAMILQALTARPGASDSPSSAPAAKEGEKPSSAKAAAPDPTAASLLLAWLTPPLVTLAQSLPHKGSARSVPVVPSALTDQAAPAQAAGGSKSTKTAVQEKASQATGEDSSSNESNSKSQQPKSAAAAAEKPLLAAVQALQPSDGENKTATASGSTDASEKLPLVSVQGPSPKVQDGKTIPPSGTSAANSNQRMRFTPESNENAGRAEQKLPTMAVSAIGSADTGGPSSDGGAKSSLAFSWHEAPSEAVTITDFSALAGTPAAPVAPTVADIPVSAAGATQTERLEQMVSRELMTIRQTGAESLGVSLKLDANTQLYLQLTTHNGSIQASVRLERGSFAPEEAQWAQLQQSLARQNVALLPMTGGSNLNFQQPSGQHSRQQQAAAREDWATAGTAVQPAQPRKQKEQNRSRKNWESWA